MVYTVTSGFYPQLFSKLNKGWQSKKGKGRKGMQWAPKGGFSAGSIKTVQKKPRLKEEWIGEFFGKMRSGKTWKEAYGGASDAVKGKIKSRTDKLDIDINQEDMENKLSESKFLGDTETYQLWGSRVWFQNSARSNKNSEVDAGLAEWQKWLGKKDLVPYLQNLYTRKEPALVAMAQDMAREAFGAALKKDNLREDLKSVGTESDVPEEERKEIKGGKKTNAIPKSWQKISQARELDIKNRMDNGTTIYADSTETPLHREGQHGIMDYDADLVKAISTAKEGGAKEIEELRAMVVKMFVANAGRYNDSIRDLVESATPKGEQSQGLKTIKKLLTKITKDNKTDTAAAKARGEKPNLKRQEASVRQVAKEVGMEYAKDSARETAMKYILHMIPNLAGDANESYRQGHLVGQIGNQNSYASIPMQLVGLETMPEFSTDIIKAEHPDGVLMLQGESHILALREHYNVSSAAIAIETKARQIQAFQTGKILGINASGALNSSTHANFNARTKVRPTTTVTFNPKGMENIIENIPKLIKDNVDGNEIQKKGKSFMKDKSKHKISDLHGGFNKGQSSAKFWALPYIGLMQYPTKSK
jgi:hypothetical protein